MRKSGGALLRLAPAELTAFLGVKKNASGTQKAAGKVELVVPAAFAWEERESESGEPARGFPWTLSTYDLDRHYERIDPLGWELAQYMLNPVVEWAHRYDIPAIGKIEGLSADAQGLHGAIVFNDKAYDPFGWSIGERVRAGVLRAGSVGFRPIEIEIPDGDETALIFRKQELLEFSVCNVPANPCALAKSGRSARKNGTHEIALPGFWGSIINSQEEQKK